MDIGILLLLFLVGLIFAILSRYYGAVPEIELKRRSKTSKPQDSLNWAISKDLPVAQFYLKIFGFTAFFGAVYIANANFSPWLATLISAVLVILYLLGTKYLPFKNRLAKTLSKPFFKLITKTKPYLRSVSRFISKYFTDKQDHKLYELDDLIQLINDQKGMKFNRISNEKLQLAVRALGFSDKKVADYMLAKKDVRLVSSEETIGTILIDELHKTGQRHFPVYKDKKSNIIGILDLDELIEKRTSGKVAWAISQEVHELTEVDSLQVALELFIKSKQQLYIVRGDDQKMVGVIGISKVLSELLG